MLLNALKDLQPTHLAVAFDVSRESFRTAEYPQYKATRAASPAEFSGQVALIKEVLDALRIVHIEKPGFEADDIIATLATEADRSQMRTWICTGDRDALQLVSDNVTVVYPRKGFSDVIHLTPQAVKEKYLVPPERYPELAALVGESSDNLPGVPGVGPKTAAKWLAAYDGLDNLLARAEQVTGKAGESFREHLDDVVRNRRLNALVRDLDLEVSIKDTQRAQWDLQPVNELFGALEFRVLWERLNELQPHDDTASALEAGPELSGAILEPDAVADWLQQIAGKPAGVDFSGYWGSGTGEIYGIAIAVDADHVGFIDVTNLTDQGIKALAQWLCDQDSSKLIHDAKGPMLACLAHGWQLCAVEFDTHLAAYLLRPDQRSYELEDLVPRYLNRHLSSAAPTDQGQSMLDFGIDQASAHEAMERAAAVRELSQVLRQEVTAAEALELLTRVELPLQRRLVECERDGIQIAREVLDELRASFDAAVVEAQRQAWDVLGHQVNLGSPKQLQGVLFDELAMPKTKRTKSGYTTNAEALEALYAKTSHPFLKHLLAHRDAIKLRQTVEGLLTAIQPDGRIHTTYLQTIAATGRLSSADPNLQNIPVRTTLGRKIRDAFIPGPGFTALMTADYSQIEMRIMAHLSGDDKVIEAFTSGRDFHSEMAATVFGVEPSQVDSEMRARIKAMNYGLAYGLSAYGLSNQLGVSVTEAKTLMEDYFSRVGGVRQYLLDVVEKARKQGFTSTMLGRRRYLADLNSSNRQRREMAERAALNSPIQGSAADIIKIAMLDVATNLERAGLESRILMQVHDELVLEIADGEAETVEQLVRQAMGGAANLSVPLEVSVGLGNSWFTAAHD